jgi:outer membrane receptor protein involved in Fe transport
MRTTSGNIKVAQPAPNVFRHRSAILLASLVSAGVFAQEVPGQAKPGPVADSPAGDATPSIVVTGTRVTRAGYTAPTPLTVVGEEFLVDRAPSVLIEAISLLPAARNTATPMTGGQAIGGTGGGSFLNLRGLGANRTLVLVNGERMTPTTNIGTVDIAVLPQLLVKRIDIVTGGASAAYGSDAVAGVANIVLDTRLNGLKTNVEAGISSHSDGGTKKAGLAWGGDLGDRAHLVLGIEGYKSEAVPVSGRNDLYYAVGTVPNSNYTPTNGQKPLVVAPYVYYNNMTFGGLITGGPLANTQFLPGGATAPYQPCGPVVGVNVVCPRQRNDLAFFQRVADLTAPQKRYSGYANLSFDVSPDVKVHGDFLYGESKTNFHSVPPATVLLGAFNIQRDNAYLPAGVAAQMDAAGVKSFPLGRFSAEFGSSEFTRFSNVYRGSLGVDMSLAGSWKATAYTAYGESNYNWRYDNADIPANFNRAVDAVVNPANGQIVCRSTLSNPGNGCVPINLFGEGAPNLAAKAYAYGTGLTYLHLNEFNAGGRVSGEPFSTWAGAVSVAAGAEYRSTKEDQTVDAIQAARGFAYNNQQPLSGKMQVREAFLETVVPLGAGLPMMKSLDVNGAVRKTNYSTSGDATTWKFGGTYEPNSSVRFRAVRSRDIRAPNILELNSRLISAGAGTTVIDPRTKTQVNAAAFSSGNPSLQAEVAITSSAGIVLQPAFLPKFNLSLDYYAINLTKAIQTLTAQQTVDQCQAGNASICGFITRDTGGAITSIVAPYANLATITTNGLDLESSYRFDLGAAGKLEVRGLANFVRKYAVDLGTGKVNYAGDVLSYNIPKLGWDIGARYRNGDTTVSANASGLGPAKYSIASASLIQNNSLPGVWYLGAGIEQRIKRGEGEWTVYVRADNILNKKPPMAFPTQAGSYDRIGPYFKLGVRFSM